MARNRVVRRSGGSFRRSPGRLTEWFFQDFQTGVLQITANTFQVLTSLSAAGLAKRPFTITRTVGSLYVRSDQVAAIEDPFGALGALVLSEKAVATGATATPDPVTEGESDSWFMYMTWYVGGNSTANAGKDWAVYNYDSRAQRKVEDGESISFILSNANTAHSCTFIHNFRMLVKLS